MPYFMEQTNKLNENTSLNKSNKSFIILVFAADHIIFVEVVLEWINRVAFVNLQFLSLFRVFARAGNECWVVQVKRLFIVLLN